MLLIIAKMIIQTSILAEGFRSLREGERVEFDVEVSEDGRAKAINVTGPGGLPPQVRSTVPDDAHPTYFYAAN